MQIVSSRCGFIYIMIWTTAASETNVTLKHKIKFFTSFNWDCQIYLVFMIIFSYFLYLLKSCAQNTFKINETLNWHKFYDNSIEHLSPFIYLQPSWEFSFFFHFKRHMFMSFQLRTHCDNKQLQMKEILVKHSWLIMLHIRIWSLYCASLCLLKMKWVKMTIHMFYQNVVLFIMSLHVHS